MSDIIMFFGGFAFGVILIITSVDDNSSFHNTKEYKVEEKLEIVGQDTTQYIRIIKK